MKKVIALIASIFIIALSIIPIVGAVGDTDIEVSAVIPSEDYEPVYDLLFAGGQSLPNDNRYYIVGISDVAFENITSVPNDSYGLKLFLDFRYEDVETSETYDLYDGNQIIASRVTSGRYASNLFLTNGSGDLFTYAIYANLQGIEDYMIVVTQDGRLGYLVYDIADLNVVSRGYVEYPLYGNIVLHGQSTSGGGYTYDQLVQAKDQGYAEGYQKGANDQAQVFQNSLPSIKSEEYTKGFNEGKQAGIKEVSLADNQKEYWYNVGYLAGQNTNYIVDEGITGFWDALEGFISPFLSIGIGSLTVGTVLAIVLICGLAFIIIRMTRG